MNLEKFSWIRTLALEIIIILGGGTLAIFLSATICAWLLDNYIAPALVSASRKMLSMNWDTFQQTLLGILALAIVLFFIRWMFSTKTRKREGSSHLSPDDIHAG